MVTVDLGRHASIRFDRARRIGNDGAHICPLEKSAIHCRYGPRETAVSGRGDTRHVTTDAQSAELFALAHQIVDQLETLDSRLIRGETSFMPHTEHASRARDVSEFLAAGLVLVQQRLYTQAFALLRTALECWAVDAVILVGDRYVQEVPCDSPDEAQESSRAGEMGPSPTSLTHPTSSSRGRGT